MLKGMGKYAFGAAAANTFCNSDLGLFQNH